MRITYEIITSKSAEHGDAEERGFIEPKYEIQVPIAEAMNDSDWPDASLKWTLRDAERYLGQKGMEDCGRWFQTIDPHPNYKTGAETYYSLHPGDSVTPASYARLKRIFCHGY